MAVARYTQNPNEIHGKRACMAVGNQKGHDCKGDWLLFEGIKVFDPAAPLAVVCEYHAAEAVRNAKGIEPQRLGYAGVPETDEPHFTGAGNGVPHPSPAPPAFPVDVVKAALAEAVDWHRKPAARRKPRRKGIVI